MNFKKGEKVFDYWWPKLFGIGEIIKVLKTRIYIDFTNMGILIYDKAHYKFLRKVIK